MALSQDPVNRARQLANLELRGNWARPGWRGGNPKGYHFPTRYFGLHCVLCDGQFDAETTKQRFCSAACHAEAHRIKKLLDGEYRAGKSVPYRSLAERLGAKVQTGSAIARTLARAEQLR